MFILHIFTQNELVHISHHKLTCPVGSRGVSHAVTILPSSVRCMAKVADRQTDRPIKVMRPAGSHKINLRAKVVCREDMWSNTLKMYSNTNTFQIQILGIGPIMLSYGDGA